MTTHSGDRQPSGESRIRSYVREYGPIIILLCLTVGINVWWVQRHRIGSPFDIDESGYLQRALVDSFYLSNHGIDGFIHHLRSPDPQAPLLPATAAVVRSVTGTGLIGMMLVQQLWYSVTVICTWLMARRLSNKWGAISAAIIVATIPAAFISSRTFQFALIATATFTAAIAAQLWAGSFLSLQRALVWGALLGTASLSRTMVLGLLPGLLIAAGIRLIGSGITGIRVRNFLLGLLVATLTAFSWYSASWRNVLNYLQSYGYGSASTNYGEQSSVLTTTWWTTRPIHVVQTALWAPTTLLLVILLFAAIAQAMVSRIRKNRSADKNDTRFPAPHQNPESKFSKIQRLTASDLTTLAVIGIWSYLALSSTPNTGSWFELPVLPALIVLLIALACRTTVTSIAIFGVSVLTGGLVFFADSTARFDPPTTWSFKSASVVAFDSRGWLRTYADAFLPVDTTPSIEETDHWLRAEALATTELARAITETSAENSRSPVVFLATQDPFVNTNSIALEVFIAENYQLPIGLLKNEAEFGYSFDAQLTEPRFGQPNLVVIGPNSASPAASSFSPLSDPLSALPALLSAGFTYQRSVKLPDGRNLELWWREVGATSAG